MLKLSLSLTDLFCLSLRKNAFCVSAQGCGSNLISFWTTNGNKYQFHNGNVGRFVGVLGEVKNVIQPLYFMKFHFTLACLTCVSGGLLLS